MAMTEDESWVEPSIEGKNRYLCAVASDFSQTVEFGLDAHTRHPAKEIVTATNTGLLLTADEN